MKKRCFSFLIAFSFASANAANEYYPIGTRAIGLGNAAVTIADSWAVFNNIAGIAGLENTNAGVFYERRFNFSGFNIMAVGANKPVHIKTLNVGNAGLGIYRFGDDLYNESRINLGWAHKIMSVSLGLQLEYLQVSIYEIGTKSNTALNFGGQVQITKTLGFGASIYNINQAKLAVYQDERVPTIMKAGLSYRPVEKLMLNAEIEKDIEKKPVYKAGVEFAIIESIIVRTGINVNPQVQFFGFTFKNKILDISYSITLHPQLGVSHAFGIGYKFISRKDKIDPTR